MLQYWWYVYSWTQAYALLRFSPHVVASEILFNLPLHYIIHCRFPEIITITKHGTLVLINYSDQKCCRLLTIIFWLLASALQVSCYEILRTLPMLNRNREMTFIAVCSLEFLEISCELMFDCFISWNYILVNSFFWAAKKEHPRVELRRGHHPPKERPKILLNGQNNEETNRLKGWDKKIKKATKKLSHMRKNTPIAPIDSQVMNPITNP